MGDVEFKDDPFFADAEFCTLIDNPEYLVGVQNQGATNACYAFVVVNCIHADMSKNTTVGGMRGSEQEFLDCLHIDYPPKGVVNVNLPPPKEGYPSNYRNAFQYVIKNRLCLNRDYPWSGSCGICLRNKKYHDSKISIENYKHIMSIKEVVDRLREHYAITGSVILTPTLYRWRGTGVYTVTDEVKAEMEEQKKENVQIRRHAITLIGYGIEDSMPYFVAQNSYGVGWGHRGYFKIAQSCVSNFYCVQGSCLKVEEASTRKQKDGGLKVEKASTTKQKDGGNREQPVGSFKKKKAKHV